MGAALAQRRTDSSNCPWPTGTIWEPPLGYRASRRHVPGKPTSHCPLRYSRPEPETQRGHHSISSLHLLSPHLCSPACDSSLWDFFTFPTPRSLPVMKQTDFSGSCNEDKAKPRLKHDQQVLRKEKKSWVVADAHGTQESAAAGSL